MNKFGSILVASFGVLASIAVQAGGSLDISLKNEMVRLEHEATQVGTGAHITIGGAYTETNEHMFSVGLNGVDTTSQSTDWLGGVGFKGYVWSTNDTHFSVAIGGFTRYTPDYMNGMGLEAHLYYSPDIISFLGAESFQEMMFRVNYKVMPQARIFIGYHDLSGTVTGGAREKIDSGYHIGFRMNY